MLKGLDRWKVLNSKEVKVIAAAVKQQWGSNRLLPIEQSCSSRTCSSLSGFSSSCGFLEGKDGDIFLISRDIEKLDLQQLRINSLGLYFGQLRNGELRLSIEGSQIVGKAAAKNVIEFNDEELRLWMRGEEIEKNADNCSGYVIIKHNDDFVGCGKYKDKERKILNFVPKARRVSL